MTSPAVTERTVVDDLISTRLRASDYRDWRAQVEATRGCAAPIHLRGSSRVLDCDGTVLLEREGTVLAPCGNRRERLPALLAALQRGRLPPAARRAVGRRHQGNARHGRRPPARLPDPDRALVRARPQPRP